MENIFSFLEKWNFWGQRPDTGVVRRQYIAQLDRFFNIPEIVVLTGVRRSGKSTILMQLIEYAHKKYEIPYKNFLYVNFEDPNFSRPVKTEEVYALIDFYKKEIKPKGKIYIFFDEAQEVLNWQRILLAHYEQKQDIKFFVTGSSSELFDSRQSTLLSGRTVNVKVAPLDFKEFLLFKKAKKTPTKIYGLLKEYMQYGGFPRVVLEDSALNKAAILSSYYNTILEKDIIVKFDIRKDLELRNLARYLMSNNGAIASSVNLEKSLRVSSPSIISYMNFMKSSFLIHLNNLFSYSVKQQIYNPPKMYSVDTGLANIAGFNFALNSGLMLESLVNSVLYKNNRDVCYWKNEVEVDFVTNNVGEVNLYNVTTTVDDDTVFEREIRSLEEGAKKLKAKNTTLLTLYNNTKRKDPRIVNLLDFLLD
ncbi:MAG: ATP-binding protein [Patescibacteria group bacterium]|nr:ATP-binding protein [Patescibacteria group bacterium]